MTATLPNGIVYRVEVDWVGSGTYVDITSDVVSVNISRGRDRELDEFKAGTATVTLRNDTRKYDPTNTAGPYYGNIVPLKKIRIQATHSSTLENLFAGRVVDYNLEYERYDTGVTVLRCVDDFDTLNDASTRDVLAFAGGFPPPQQQTNTAIDTPVTMMTPTFGTTYTTGNSRVQLPTFVEAYRSNGEYQAMPMAQKIAEAEQGYFFCDRNGKVAFKGRYFVYDTTPAFTAYDTSAAAGASNPVYQNLRVDYSSRYIYNQITALSAFSTNAESTVGQYDAGRVVGISTASQDAYGVRKLSLDNLPLATTGDPIGSTETGLEYRTQRVDLTNWLLLKYQNPELRIASIDLQIQQNAAAYTQAFVLDIGDTINVARTFASGTPATSTDVVAVENITHRITPQGHTVQLGFGSTVNRVWFTLDSTAFGLLDGDGLLAW